MKRLITLLLAAALCLSFTACGKVKKKEAPSSTTASAKESSSKESSDEATASDESSSEPDETASEETPSAAENPSSTSSASNAAPEQQTKPARTPSAPATSSQQPSAPSEETQNKPWLQSNRLRDLTEAELQTIADAALNQINHNVQMCNGGHELTPDSDLSALARHINELQSAGVTDRNSLHDSIKSLPEMKPFLDASDFNSYYHDTNWNQRDYRWEDFMGMHAPYDSETGNVDLVQLGKDFAHLIWLYSVSLDNENYRYIGVSANLINGRLYVAIICASSKTK